MQYVICMYACLSGCLCVCLSVCLHVWVNVCICIYASMYACTYVFVHVCMFAIKEPWSKGVHVWAWSHGLSYTKNQFR